MSFAKCRREDVIKHRWNPMSVTGTEYVLIISGQKVKLERKVAKIVFKMSACSVEIMQRLQVVFLWTGFKATTEHKHSAVSWELLTVLISAFGVQLSASLIFLILRSRALKKACFVSRSLVQRTKGGLKWSIKILSVLFIYSLLPVQPAAWDTDLLSLKSIWSDKIQTPWFQVH